VSVLGQHSGRAGLLVRSHTTVRRLVPHVGLRQFGKYAVVGAGNTVLDTLLYVALLALGVGYVGAKLLAAAGATLNGFAWNRRWTFRARSVRLTRLPRYALVQGAGTGLNLGLLVLLVEGAGMGPLTAQLVAVPAVASATFAANKLWTFARAR